MGSPSMHPYPGADFFESIEFESLRGGSQTSADCIQVGAVVHVAGRRRGTCRFSIVGSEQATYGARIGEPVIKGGIDGFSRFARYISRTKDITAETQAPRCSGIGDTKLSIIRMYGIRAASRVIRSPGRIACDQTGIT